MKDESKMFTVVLLIHQNATHVNYIIKSKLKANAIFKVLPPLKDHCQKTIAIVCYLLMQMLLVMG